MAARNVVRITFDSSDDTLRCSLIPHLSAAFTRKGISLLTDKHDDEFCESVASLLVFSKNYVSSKEFLAQVVKAIQHRHDKEHLVAVIFYGVSRSDVQELKGIFDKGYFEHGILEQLCQWKKALSEIERLPTHEASNNQSDCEFVEKIARDVYGKIFPKERIGVYSRMIPDIENLVCTQQWGVKSIGFWGMPGIGKTMLAKALYEQISADFEVTCFLQNFHETFQKEGLYGLMQEHFKNLQNQKLEQRVLLVLDDVRNHLEAEYFLGGRVTFSHGSLIIVTSRDVEVLNQCRVNQTYKVEGLNKAEALQLFSWCSFEREVTEKNLLTELSEVIEYANGNPLALRLYGKEMSSLKDPNQKKTFLPRLKQTPPDQIVEVVESSYYALSGNEKNILMYIAFFFTGQNVEDVSPRLRDLGFSPEIGIDRLVENSLVTIAENRLEMHSMVQAVVRKIGRPQLNINEDFKRSFKCVLGTTDIEAISLDASILNSDVKIPSLESMYNLIFLKIYNSKPESGCEALMSLPYGLRILHWENYPLPSLPQDFDPSNLVELNMPYSQLQTLWGGSKNLKKLKRINLSHSQNLREVKELTKAINLEQINLCGCKNLQTFPAIDDLQKLRVVDLQGVTRIKIDDIEFPYNVELKFDGSSIEKVFSPYKVNDRSLHKHSDMKEKPHFLDVLKRSGPKRITYPDIVESTPTFKDLVCEKAREMGQSLQSKLKKYGTRLFLDKSEERP